MKKQQKPKELELDKEYKEYKDWCFNNKQFLGRMFDSDGFWNFYLKQTLTQQRTELLEEIKNLKCLKEEELKDENNVFTLEKLKPLIEFNKDIFNRNQLRKEIKNNLIIYGQR